MTTSQTYQTDDDQLAREHDQTGPEDNVMEPETSLAAPGLTWPRTRTPTRWCQRPT